MKSIQKENHYQTGHHLASLISCLVCCSFACLLTGCTALRSPWSDGSESSSGMWPRLPFGPLAGSQSATDTAPESAAENEAPKITTADDTDAPSATTRLVGFVTGKTQNLEKARQLYKSGDVMFRKAETASKSERVKIFSEAAEYFEDAGDAAPGSALQQDALFMQGESLFFADEYKEARDVFEKLQKEFPRSRHSDRVAARLFSISKFWIDIDKSDADRWYNLHMFDKTRPWIDTAGHAVKILDQIRYDDPTGKLADDATMAAAAENIRKGDFEAADEFLTDLRETFTDSDHLFLAHLLGVQCKLEIYAGPRYSERVLDEADKLVEQTKRRFPDRLREKKYADMIARAAATIDYHKAEKYAYRARYRRRQGENKAASQIYQQILAHHPSTPQADEARDALAGMKGQPDKPTRWMASLTKVFPDTRVSSPLEMSSSGDSEEATEETTGETKWR